MKNAHKLFSSLREKTCKKQDIPKVAPKASYYICKSNPIKDGKSKHGTKKKKGRRGILLRYDAAGRKIATGSTNTVGDSYSPGRSEAADHQARAGAGTCM